MQPIVTPQLYRGYLGGIDKPPCCRHERLIIVKERRIKELEEEVKSLQEKSLHVDVDDAENVALLQEEIVRRQHYEALLESQSRTIRDLQELLRQQHQAIQDIFGENPSRKGVEAGQEASGILNFAFGQPSQEKEAATGKPTGDSLGRSFFSG